MRSWPAPQIPDLPGSGLPLRLYDTATAGVRPTAPGEMDRMYVCGITPYDATHLGHAATYLAFDLVHRAWLDAGHRVAYVQNVTDVDDPLLERAMATGQDWRELAARETTLFRSDMTALRVLPPTVYLGAVEAMPLIAAAIEELEHRGFTYRVGEDTYLDLAAAPDFGSVAGLDEQVMLALFAERGGDPERPGKRHPLDPLLWQAARPDEPAWDTPVGHGRPGWHIECVAMALQHLGPSFDLQGGGRDLAFPHHEMGAAQGELLTGTRPFARHYMHTGLVGLGGEKMSKSLGNLVFVSELLRKGADPMAIRVALLSHHYREDWQWHSDELPAAQHRLNVWREAVSSGTGPPGESLLARVRERISDDLDAPAALRALDDWATQARRSRQSRPEAGALVAATADALLGVDLGGA